jgi:hypothetical protein
LRSSSFSWKSWPCFGQYTIQERLEIDYSMSNQGIDCGVAIFEFNG